MSLPILKINHSQLGNNGGTLGFDFIVGTLKDSKLFEVQNHNEKINTVKGFRGTVLYFNDKRIYLDFWEYSAPTHTNEIINENFDLIIKLQHKDVGIREYLSFVRRGNYFPEVSDDKLIDFYNKIVPWTFFPSKNMMPYIGQEDKLVSLPVEQNCFFCGRNWKCRHDNKWHMDKEGITYICNEVERISDERYMHLMLSSKFGLIFPGRSTHISDSKNRREIDYAMMRKPMLISYHPNYYDKWVHGKHFILIDKNTNFKTLDQVYNIEEMTKNAFEWYQRNVTPEGMVNMFFKIMKDRGFTK